MRRLGRVAWLALIVVGLVALLAASAASAATYTVNSIGDQADEIPGTGGCETSVHNCTLRAAIEESNTSTTVDDTIVFSALFNGESLGTIALGSGLPKITDAATIEGKSCTTAAAGAKGPCVGVSGGAIQIEADGVVVEGLAISGVNPGIEVLPAAHGAEVKNSWMGRALDGTPTFPAYGFYVRGPEAVLSGNSIFANQGISLVAGASGTLVEGNTIVSSSNKGINIESSSNEVFGNTISGAFYAAIWVTAPGNRIGGDTTKSENVLESYYAPIWLAGDAAEIGQNRGHAEPSSTFIDGPGSGALAKPQITGLRQSTAKGTGEMGAKVRLFRMAGQELNAIESFLGYAIVGQDGSWNATFPSIPVGSWVSATQTKGGATSALVNSASAQADQSPPPPVCPAAGATGCETPPTPDTTKPKVTIKSAPKAKSSSITAKFKFTSSVAGSSFQCKFDTGKFKKCKSPKTYEKLKPGKHVFKVKATDAAGNVSAVLTRMFTVLAP